jgi:predicted O-linked N-acetylglucosamine transferase (SPINDLY family)
MNNSDRYTQQQMYEEALRWDRTHSASPHDAATQHRSTAKKNSRIRIGLVSADYRQHPGGMLFYPFIEHYDRNSLEIFCYYNNHKYDDMTHAIKSKCDTWREVISLSNQQLFDTVRKDKIDVLIDMNGHTDKNRLKFFSMKPCRIQATWLGFFNTTGVSAINYFISDDFTTPDWMQKCFSEKIVRLPHSRFCYVAPDYSPLISLSPAEWKGYVTFGAFNNCSKLSDTTIKMWAGVLKNVPKSRMMLKWKSYRDKSVREWIIGRFQQEGISKNRILMRNDINHAQMLADYSSVDIVLDTFPFNGGMTSIEALWMGVPIVTLAGTTPASRQTGSFLRLLGLDELIAETQDEYIAAAVKLASDRTRLYDIRSSLRLKMKRSPLMDGQLFAKNMQTLFEQMLREQRISS